MKKIATALSTFAAMAAISFSANAAGVTDTIREVAANSAAKVGSFVDSTVVEGTAAVSLSDINSHPLALGAEAGAKLTNGKMFVTLGGGAVKTPDWDVGTMRYAVATANYKVDYTPGLAVGAGVIYRNHVYRPFVQLTGEINQNYDLTLRMASRGDSQKRDDIISFGVARKF